MFRARRGVCRIRLAVVAAAVAVYLNSLPLAAQAKPDPQGTAGQTAGRPDSVLLTVNGEDLTYGHFTSVRAREANGWRLLSDLMGADPGQAPADVRRARPPASAPGLVEGQSPGALADATGDALLDAVDEILLIQRGIALGYRLSDQAWSAAVEDIKVQNKIPTEEAFRATLAAENLTMADLRRKLDRRHAYSLVTSKIRVELLERVSISERELTTYYETHTPEFTAPATLMLREILVAVPQSPEGRNLPQDDAAKAKADALRARLTAGESFAAIVSEASEASSKAAGGRVGPVSISDVTASLRAVFEGLKPGDITPVLRTNAGYSIYRVDSMTATTVPGLDQARNRITATIARSKLSAEAVNYLQALRAGARLEWSDGKQKTLFEQAATRQAAAAASGTLAGPAVAASRGEVDAPKSQAPPTGSELDRIRAAAERGDPLSQLSLAGCYEAGTGVGKDLVDAAFWVFLALDRRAAGGELDDTAGALAIRVRLERQLSAAEVSAVQARVKAWKPTR